MAGHARDPQAAHLAAAAMGRLVGRGLLSAAEALDALMAVHGPGAVVDRGGLQARLAHRVADEAAALRARRARARLALRRAVLPLLRLGAGRGRILRAAEAAAGDALEAEEVERAAAMAVASWLERGAGARPGAPHG